MKYIEPRPYADPEAAAHKIVELANAVDQRPDAVSAQGVTAEYKAGLDRAIAMGWLMLHEGGTFVRFTQAGADLFA